MVHSATSPPAVPTGSELQKARVQKKNRRSKGSRRRGGVNHRNPAALAHQASGRPTRARNAESFDVEGEQDVKLAAEAASQSASSGSIARSIPDRSASALAHQLRHTLRRSDAAHCLVSETVSEAVGKFVDPMRERITKHAALCVVSPILFGPRTWAPSVMDEPIIKPIDECVMDNASIVESIVEPTVKRDVLDPMRERITKHAALSPRHFLHSHFEQREAKRQTQRLRGGSGLTLHETRPTLANGAQPSP